LGSFFLALFFPTLSDRIGRKLVLMIMGAMSAMVPLSFLISPLYRHAWILAVIVGLINAGQRIGALILVLVPTESVPQQFAATAIGLATLTAEILGATVAPFWAEEWRRPMDSGRRCGCPREARHCFS
jgi:MFS family permease